MADVCHFCGLEKTPLYRHRATQLIACQPCYKQHLKPKYVCTFCRHERPAGKWIVVDGQKQPVCSPCYRRRYLRDVCLYCRLERPIAMRNADGQAICTRCYLKFIGHESCSRCGKKRRVGSRDEHGAPICGPCLKAARQAICTGCQLLRTIHGVIDQQPYCRPCYRQHSMAECRHCHRHLVIYARGLCSWCYELDRTVAMEQKIRTLTTGVAVYHARSHQFARVLAVRIPVLPRGRRRFLRAKVVVSLPLKHGEETREVWPISACQLIHAVVTRPRQIRSGTAD